MSNNYDLDNVNIYHAVIFCLLTAIFLSIMTLLVKVVSSYTTTGVIIFSRFLISFVYIVLILSYHKLRGNQISLKPQKLSLHIVRALCGAGSILCLYYSLRFVPLMDASLLATTSPLFVPIFALLIFKMRTKLAVLVSVTIGFFGIILVIKPSEGLLNYHACYALVSGIFAALAIMTVRELAKRDKPEVIMFYYFLFALIMSTVFVLDAWQIPSMHTLLLLIGIGVAGSLYQDCLIRASAYAPASIISALLYLSVALNGILDWLVWRLIPDMYTILGLLIICGSSYFAVKYAKR